MKLVCKGAILCVMVCFATMPLYALTADEIVAKANNAAYYNAADGKATVHMLITDRQGRTRERNMKILRLDGEDGGEQKFYVYFDKPSDVKGMTYLVWKHIGGDDDRWLYLPALDLVRRVAASDKRSSFVGSHFFYEDISGRGIEEDNHTLVAEAGDRYEIKSAPKSTGGVEFSYYTTWIDKNTFIPVKAEYYDKNGKLYRVIEAVEIEEIEGFPTVVKMKAEDLNSGGNTLSEFKDIDYDIGLEDSLFTERYLRRPPRKHIK